MLGCAALDNTGTLDDNSTQLWVPLSLRVKESSRWFAQWLAIRLSWTLDHSLPLRVEGAWHRSIAPSLQRPSYLSTLRPIPTRPLTQVPLLSGINWYSYMVAM
ncbi:hypothetical protein B0O80DRAFT_433976 [Mortierella sp. GBAus27b]|nr:hypothetical protein B0O80DRAFT_433976 [Mortierella sp. GBAus27b]